MDVTIDPGTAASEISGLTIESWVEAFRLPVDAQVERRIPKKLLIEQGTTIASDRRLINEAVEALWWRAAMKAGTIGVPAFQRVAAPSDQGVDASYLPVSDDVLELAVVTIQFRDSVRESQARRLRQLIHRAIPYPVLLIAENAGGFTLSLAHKRASLGEGGQWVVVEIVETHSVDRLRRTEIETAFMAWLALERQPHTALLDLSALYQAYADRVIALAVARVTGLLVPPMQSVDWASQRALLVERDGTLNALTTTRGEASKATQLNRRVELNQRIQRLQGDLAHLEGRLVRPAPSS